MKNLTENKTLLAFMVIVIAAALGLAVTDYLNKRKPVPVVVPAQTVTETTPEEETAQIGEETLSPALPIVLRASGSEPGTTIEALNAALRASVPMLSVELNWTSDNQLVCVDDWASSLPSLFKNYAGDGTAVTLEQFSTLEINTASRPCTFDSFVEWLKRNPAATIVLNIQDNEEEGFTQLKAALPTFDKQIIPQVKMPRMKDALTALGYTRVIWSPFYFERDDEGQKMASIAARMMPYAVVMNARRATRPMITAFAEQNIPVYVRYIDNCRQLHRFSQRGTSGVYTVDSTLNRCFSR